MNNSESGERPEWCDVGARVMYSPPSGHGSAEFGTVRSWNRWYVFVLFDIPGQGPADIAEDWTAQACRAEDLTPVIGFDSIGGRH